MLPLHLLLELQEPVHESLCCGRTPGNIDINRNNPIAASHHRVAVVIVSSSISTASHAHHPPRLRHLVVHLPECWSHLVCESSSHDDHISLARRSSEHDAISEKYLWSVERNKEPQSHLSMSYLGAAMCIISTAQHARPNVKGHREP